MINLRRVSVGVEWGFIPVGSARFRTKKYRANSGAILTVAARPGMSPSAKIVDERGYTDGDLPRGRAGLDLLSSADRTAGARGREFDVAPRQRSVGLMAVSSTSGEASARADRLSAHPRLIAWSGNRGGEGERGLGAAGWIGGTGECLGSGDTTSDKAGTSGKARSRVPCPAR